ncbi:bifunctional glutamate N-acetyltransferase/amino-acid acetyltransferase ArgJ [Kordiimonas marina]|uniref:bifunctional glutamate N-acetyltransferase/amino-acid acetyltransferase ArgJ n=1 Tax=Kordiimonas marina TaxID=2872312 RepID=UPI001FF49F53|nr:bifunctional glutamate N-acetyltransferase/amino-acid acetyltransferase ArgJ [Kordiimonas marina]MCJ9430464.1 bifunctional glutamate N-acetyltransferase/amino-acid acetyltransferase ArgJ [Kordiimonas marina]
MVEIKVSPLAPAGFPNLLPVPGVEMGAVYAGFRKRERPDLLMAVMAEGSVSAGTFTRTKAPAAPVDWSKSALEETGGKARAIVVNAGNANAFTGERGMKAAVKAADAAAKVVGCEPIEVLLASTGVIGVPLNGDLFEKPLARIHAGLSGALWRDAANAIMTTDTYPKGACRVTHIDGKTVVISGIAKGSGMIAPDMATMLGFVFTNAALTYGCLQKLLRDSVDVSFNSITVDGDTSTNDSVFAVATGTGMGHDPIGDPNDPRLDDFKVKFREVLTELAHLIVRDGEGATKFVTVTIEGAESDKAAHRIAMSVANSPLVKTAIAGEDANWGRLVMAVGKAGEKAERDKLQIWIGGQPVAAKGAVLPSYSEEKATEHMKGQMIDLRVDVGVGEGRATVWTCDLTYDYIRINADYRS